MFSAALSWNQRSARNSGWLRLAWTSWLLRLRVASGVSSEVRLVPRLPPALICGSRPERAWGTTSLRAR